MAKTRGQKEEIVARIADKFRNMKAAAFSSVSGFTMNQANELRAQAREQGAEVFITKKTLLGLAVQEAGLDDVDPRSLDGSILTAISYDDEVTAAKIIKDFSKKNESLKIVAGILEGKSISAEKTEQLAALPGKQQLLGQLVGTLNAPVSGFVNVLAGNMRGLVTVLGAIKDQKA
ncbi:50S ribosomal protein L10 [Patescibacteria group bacterium]|nr:50S ribosomal protein L10 [Patescibacteria group bacterium]